MKKNSFLNKVVNGLERNMNKINLIMLATSLITLNPTSIGLCSLNFALSKLASYDTFIKVTQKKIQKIDEVIESLNSLPELEKDNEVLETISKLLLTKELHEKEIIRFKSLRAELNKKDLNKKAKKLSKPIAKKSKIAKS